MCELVQDPKAITYPHFFDFSCLVQEGEPTCCLVDFSHLFKLFQTFSDLPKAKKKHVHLLMSSLPSFVAYGERRAQIAFQRPDGCGGLQDAGILVCAICLAHRGIGIGWYVALCLRYAVISRTIRNQR